MCAIHIHLSCYEIAYCMLYIPVLCYGLNKYSATIDEQHKKLS